MREWRGWVPNAKAKDYVRVLEQTGLKDLAATPGNRGTILLQTVVGEETEFVLMSLWQSEAHIRAFAGADVTLARYYPEDDDYLTFKAKRIRHYNVIADVERETA